MAGTRIGSPALRHQMMGCGPRCAVFAAGFVVGGGRHFRIERVVVVARSVRARRCLTGGGRVWAVCSGGLISCGPAYSSFRWGTHESGR